MTDLRDRLARVAAARKIIQEVETRSEGRQEVEDSRPGGPSGYKATDQRFELRALGLEIVGVGPPDPIVLAHLGLRGQPPRRWEDILFLDTETTGLSSGAGTYVFLLGTAYIADGELV
ncbi:MAG TPA: hypothetical protein VE261_00620, partial [Gaiellaceae bacterium]|nr:hypothetical protein [Gaiellaceae bacterium]